MAKKIETSDAEITFEEGSFGTLTELFGYEYLYSL